MENTDKKTVTIGKKNYILPRKNSLGNSVSASNDNDIINFKTTKLNYYVLGGLTLISIIIIGIFVVKYINSEKKNIIEEQQNINTFTKNENQDDSIIIDEEEQLPKNKNINLDPKTKDEQFSLGVRYLQGNGVNKNYSEAIKWFTLAATQEHSNSQLMLGKIYYYGEFVKPDFKKALIWNTLAAAQGLSEAQYMLGLIYENGSGVPEDKAEAKKWYILAASQGLKDAKEKLSISQSSFNSKSSISNSSPKLVTQEDLIQVNKYLSNIKKDTNKNPELKSNNSREIIWN
jgi:hypothetical protein